MKFWWPVGAQVDVFSPTGTEMLEHCALLSIHCKPCQYSLPSRDDLSPPTVSLLQVEKPTPS